jgi:hypothetical protein
VMLRTDEAAEAASRQPGQVLAARPFLKRLV